MRSPSEKVRQAAGKQLVALRDKRAARRLKAAYIASSSAGARVWILRAIVAIGSREAIEICRVALKSADVEQRRVAAMALSRYGKSETLSLLLSAIEDKDETVRVCVIQALGRFKSKTLLPQLVKVARSDTSWRVRRAAIRALIEIDPKQALPLVSSSLRDGREEVRVATARAMASMLDPRFASALATALADKSAKVRHHAARGLALSATAAEVPALEQALTSVPDPGTRSYIVRALARVGAPSGIPGLTQAMSDRHHSVRSTAASLAGALKLSNLVPPLCKLLQDSNDAVRLSAAEALGKIGDPRAVEPLWQLIGRGSDPVRRSALEALGTIPGAAALGRLVTAAKELSADRELISVVKILKTRVAPLGIPGLVAIARRGSSAVRVSAIYALAVLGLDDNATVVLRSSLGSRDSAMRQAALWTIGRLVPEELERDLIAALPREKGKLRAQMLAALAAYRTPAALKALLDAAAAEQAGSSLTVVLNHLARMRDPGAEKVLFAAVGDSRQPGSTRGAVARVLPQLPGWKSVPVLAKLLSAKDADLRRHAAYSLGQIRHPSAIEPLQAALATEKQTQNLQNILLGLSLLRGGANTPRVRGWLTPSAKDFVLYAAWAIGKSGDPQGPQLLRALAVNPKASSHIKGYLSHPLGASGLAGAHEVLMLLLADKSANVREQAIYGCWTMHDTKAAPAIAKALRDEKDYVRAGAAAVLGDLQRGVQTAALIRPLLAESSQYVQALATIGLYRCGDKPDQAPLRWSVNRARVNSGADLAAAVLATHPDPESFAGLVACLQSSSDRIAWPAGLALGRLKDKRAVPTLRGAIYGRAAIVEAFAADALLSLGIDTPRIRRSMKSTLPLLIARLLSYHPQTRAQVAALLRRRTGKSFGYDWRGSLDSWRSSRDRWFAWWDAVHRQLSYEPRSGHFKTPTGSGQQPNKPRQKTK